MCTQGVRVCVDKSNCADNEVIRRKTGCLESGRAPVSSRGCSIDFSAERGWVHIPCLPAPKRAPLAAHTHTHARHRKLRAASLRHFRSLQKKSRKRSCDIFCSCSKGWLDNELIGGEISYLRCWERNFAAPLAKHVCAASGGWLQSLRWLIERCSGDAIW